MDPRHREVQVSKRVSQTKYRLLTKLLACGELELDGVIIRQHGVDDRDACIDRASEVFFNKLARDRTKCDLDRGYALVQMDERIGDEKTMFGRGISVSSCSPG